jgi:multidrug efflux pump subunit AcrB
MSESDDPQGAGAGWSARVVGLALDGALPVLLVLLAVIAGAVALVITPREEEPQIVVPMADVLVAAPGLSAAQVERQVASPLEKLLHQIDGVEHVYSVSNAGRAVVTVRFHVGEDREDSLVKIYNKIYSNTDRVPAVVSSWVVKPVEVDDVPILMVTLWSRELAAGSDYELRRLAEEVAERIQAIEDTNRVEIVGGRARELRVELDPQALAARRTAPLEVAFALGASHARLPAGELQGADRATVLRAGTLFQSADQLREAVVAVVDGVPVYLRDVAAVHDGPAEPDTYTWLTFGPADPQHASNPGPHPAVTISVAKRRGANAVRVARDVEQRLRELRDQVLPAGVDYRLVRDHGETANSKINDLVSSLAVAVLTVVVFIGLFLGWRAALVVALAVPVCYGVTLGLDLVAGYTINRVTLFALILSLGLLVDDPITGVDNIERHLRLGTVSARQSVIVAIGEIRMPLILSTVAIVLAFAPLSFITGMMGPYMAPMAFNVPVSVLASTVVAFLVTPWLAHRVLGASVPPAGPPLEQTARYRLYAGLVGALIAGRSRAWLFLACTAALFLVALALPVLRLVPLKLLPYDNKNELQVVIDMPEGTTLERTQAVAVELAWLLRRMPEVREIAGFVGTASPMDFNAMVRHYYLRQGSHEADLRVTLVDRLHRAQQSHAMVLRIRRAIEALAVGHGASVKLVETPPGPPVIATVVVEVGGTESTPYDTLRQGARAVAARLAREPFVVDVDTSDEVPRGRLTFDVDREKAALSGVSTADLAATLSLANAGLTVAFAEAPHEVLPLPVVLRLPYSARGSPEALAGIQVKGMPGITKIRDKGGVRDAPRPLVAVGEVGRFHRDDADRSIYHKDLRPVAYAYAEVAGRAPADVVLDVGADLRRDPVEGKSLVDQPRVVEARSYLRPGGGDPWTIPAGLELRWDGEGEWDITLRVFRDLGIAFAAALVGIFIVLRVETGLSLLTLIVMLAIPLTVIGIMPGFWLLNVLGTREVDGFPDPVLFTATAMIGMIALAGIVVRNSLILIQFIHQRLREGAELRDALLTAGAVRFRPVFLTAGTTLLGNLVITLDPIFSGLAWAIIFGILASTAFTLAVVPTVYFVVYGSSPGHGLPAPRREAA